MSTVTLTIGPKSYPVACADGEEAHIEALGAMIAEKYALLGAARAPLEAQNLLFAALFLADELAEARKGKPGKAKTSPEGSAEADCLRAEIARLEAELVAARQAPPPPPTPQADLFGGAAPSAALAERLEALAEQAEATAAALEGLG
ncbi:cell division protein ZapA [Erythrobacter sp. sf7]|uniref:Cell division protein ZapA n=1 Tax=Erythrobacter fulvus TaxID=2987523 RepID=A0ABT5JKN8_9SPHN|nr:cell division protein ZapA [Erythrobacter fulvus]MDC8753139.1 cell division protein ZapA [Erythrobacter fulvus]